MHFRQRAYQNMATVVEPLRSPEELTRDVPGHVRRQLVRPGSHTAAATDAVWRRQSDYDRVRACMHALEAIGNGKGSRKACVLSVDRTGRRGSG
jgi:hypothetical protein